MAEQAQEKVAVDKNAFVYPMPMALVGVVVNQQVNFMAVGWVSRVNHQPPMIAVALGKSHLTNVGIHANRAFSVCVPGQDLLEKTDCCGLVSGEKVNKAQLFDVFYGQIPAAPMIKQCPLCMECKLAHAVDLPSNTLFVGEIVAAYAEAACLVDGQPDIAKMRPFTLTMPDNGYWAVGPHLGRAWHAGLDLARTLRSAAPPPSPPPPEAP